MVDIYLRMIVVSNCRVAESFQDKVSWCSVEQGKVYSALCSPVNWVRVYTVFSFFVFKFANEKREVQK